MTDALADNPVLAPWTGPHGGAPAFGALRVEHFEPALEAAMALYRAEIAAIAADPAPPTFANTLEALERSGRAYRQATSLMSVFTSTLNTPQMQAVQRAAAPRLAAFRDEIIQNRALFERIRAVFEARETSGLTAEQQRLADVVMRRFTRQGAALSDPDKRRLAEINQRLASLYTAFSQNILADEEGLALVLDSEADLAGLPAALVEAAAAAARERGLDGKWVIPNTRSSMDPFMTHSARRDLRQRALAMWASRGDNPGPHDNNPIITEVLKLRVEKARLLGFATFAHWVADGQMARTPDAAMELLRRVWTPAVARAGEEIAEMQPIAAAEGFNEPLEAWDYRHYAEKLRQAKYDLSDDAVKPYLQLGKLRDGMFWAAGELFGLAFTPVTDLPVYHPDVEVFEVTRGGDRVGLWYFDLYARPGKSSGAWMSEYRTQQRLAGDTPIVSNNSNFIPAAPGQPVLISWTDAVTLFHEFGHGLHGLLSSVTYPSLAGTSVVRDFVELPSQLNERWLPTPELLSRFAVHHETGEPMPAALKDKLLAAQNFRQGFDTTEYLACAILDLEAHLGADEALDARDFEREALQRLGMPREIILRHRLPHFSHVFSGEGYASGYYNYIWADVLSADAAEAFAEAPGGFYDKALADRLLREVLSVGNTVEAAEAYRRFRGRDPAADALMRSRGFETARG
ncbi:M3 family metallopeptidase [Caulobacter sp. KR2-114]|uniref:M3 family metallopeptidase n=1 Tax=Caulobacter sp. KR2-114 TaxID=3400912 RepID=UPI003C0E1AB2